MDNDGLLIFNLMLILPIPIYRNIINEVIRKRFVCNISSFMISISQYELYYDDINKQFIVKDVKFEKDLIKETLKFHKINH